MADILNQAPEKQELSIPNESINHASALEEVTEMYRKAAEKRSGELIKSYKAISAILCGVIIVLAVTIGVLAFGWYHEQGTIVPTVETVEVIKEVEVTKFTAIDPSNEYSHELSPDSFLLNDSSYGPIWMPALANVPKNSYDPEKFIKDPDTGIVTYADENVKTYRGIDVSVYQGDIDWDKVKESGVDYVIIRCGYRGYVVGSVNEDANFRRNLEGAKAAGLAVGVYFFSQAVDVDEALEEAEFCIELLDGCELEYPVFYDWEVVIDKDGDTPRTAYIQPDDLTNNALVFAERIRYAGYTPAIYTNKKTAVWKYDLSRLEGIDIWLAEYNETPSFFYDFAMWQYSSKGSVPGISGNVDMNISFKDFSAARSSEAENVYAQNDDF